MEYIRDQVAKLFEIEYIRDQVAKIYEMYLVEEEVYHDAVSHPIGFDEYFGPSPREVAPADPRNWELYWVSHPDGPLDEPKRQSTSQPGDLPELDFPKEDQPQGLLDIMAKDQHLEVSTGKSDRIMSISEHEPESEADTPEVSGDHSDAAAADLRNSIANRNNILDTETSATDSPAGSTEDATKTTTEAAPRPPSLLANLRTFLTTTPALFQSKLSGLRLPTLKLPEVKLPEVRLPTLRLPILKLPALAVSAEGLLPSTPQGAQTATPAKEPEPRHYARTPLATYARVKSRLQDRPPLVAAFADHVSVLDPSSLMPKQTSDVEVPKGHLPTAWNKLLENLGDLLPTPLASLMNTNTPRKRSLVSILGGHTAKRVFAEVEVISLPFACKLLDNTPFLIL